MANKDLLKILKQGYEAWNKWRSENPGAEVDLSVADFSQADLSGVDLSGSDASHSVNLEEANLCGAKLIKSNLQYAWLEKTDLSNADLSFADIRHATLFETKLCGAILCHANLEDADFDSSDLSGADLGHTNLSQARLVGTKLTGVKLENFSFHDEEQLETIKKGYKVWNKWIRDNPEVLINLIGIDLSNAMLTRPTFDYNSEDGIQLSQADLSWADLSHSKLTSADLSMANLSHAKLCGADLCGADLTGADLSGADLEGANLNIYGRNVSFIAANLSRANLKRAILCGADLSNANLQGADLSGADLCGAKLVSTNLEDAALIGCNIYGIAAWGLKLKGAKQDDLIIMPSKNDRIIGSLISKDHILVDDIEVAQLLYLLLNYEKIRDVIDTLGEKNVLILGRFTPPERKAVLDILRIELRKRGFLPILFDFEGPTTKDFTETVKIMAGISLFVIADISNPKSCPLELQATIPDFMVPFVPIIQKDEEPFSMFGDLYHAYKDRVLKLMEYDSADYLVESLDSGIIGPALKMRQKLLAKKKSPLPKRNARDYILKEKTRTS